MKILIYTILVTIVTGCSNFSPVGPAVISISSDGKYAISSNYGKYIILWNIKNYTKKLISDNGNIYSAYFIKNQPYFIWQDLKDIVHAQDVNNKELLSFHNSPTYGQVMTSDLKHYFASDVNWTIFEGYGKDQRQVKRFCLGDKNQFYLGKLLNLDLSNDNNFLFSSGDSSDPDPISAGMCSKVKKGFEATANSLYDGTTLWNVSSGEPLYKLRGLMTQTFGTFSPDGKYIVAGDQEDTSYVWDTKTGKRLYDVDDLLFGHFNSKAKTGFDQDGIINQPDDYKREGNGDAIFSIKFIDLNNDYLRFNKDKHYAVLLNVNSRKPIKYLYLGKFPEIVTTAFYNRNEAIDTAPAANILVVGKKYTTGIIVYKYDPKTQTLKKIWSPNLYSLPGEWWEIIKNSFITWAQ